MLVVAGPEPMEEERQVCTQLLGDDGPAQRKGVDRMVSRALCFQTSLGPNGAEQVCLAGFREEGPRSWCQSVKFTFSVRGDTQNLGACTSFRQMLAPSLSRCMILRRWLNFSKPWFPLHHIGNDGVCPVRGIVRVNWIVHGKGSV